MSEKSNDIIYTAADIEKYHKGQLSARQMNALEKAALDDPFLADALEGYTVSGVNTNADVADLKKRLSKRLEKDSQLIPLIQPKKISFAWWKVAAMIVVVIGAGLLVYQFSFNKRKNDIAQVSADKQADNAAASDSDQASSPALSSVDSSTTAVAAENQSKKTSESKPAQAPPAASDKTAVTPTKDQAIRKDEAVSAITVPAAPATIPQKEKEEQVLNDNTRQRRASAAKGEEFFAKTSEQPAVANETEKKLNNTVQGVVTQNNAKPQFKALTHTNVFRGRITDTHNNALPFSNITNTADSIGTYSDAKGYFVLTSPDSILNVQVSSIGFETSKVQLQNGIPSNNISMQEDRSLPEVVITDKKVNSRRSQDANMILEEAEPADGWNNYDIYLVNNLKTPEIFKGKQSGTKGEVELAFEVDKNGTPYNITVKKSLCESCDKEAIRLLKEGPKWKRKAKKGKATVKIAF